MLLNKIHCVKGIREEKVSCEDTEGWSFSHKPLNESIYVMTIDMLSR